MLFSTRDVSDIKSCFPIFHDLSAEECLYLLVLVNFMSSDAAGPFFVPSALSQIERVLRIAKAYHQTPMGVKFEIESGGCTVDSPEWVKRICNNPDALYAAITELTDCLENNEALRSALYDDSLKSAIDWCLERWIPLMKSKETTAETVCSTINNLLEVFTDNFLGVIIDHPGIFSRRRSE